MEYQMSFARLINYDAGLPGISLNITLGLFDTSVALTAKLDTGSTNCIFERRIGESLGFEIESGERIRIGTPTGSFTTYRHWVTLTILDYSFDVGVCFAEDPFLNRNVLGRQGFLDRMQIGLVDHEGKLFLRRNDG